jgi:hypothetical protein
LKSPRSLSTPLNFVQEGENLTVKTQGFQGDEISGTGKIKDNEIEWTITVY